MRMRGASRHGRWWPHGAGSVVPPGAGQLRGAVGAPVVATVDVVAGGGGAVSRAAEASRRSPAARGVLAAAAAHVAGGACGARLRRRGWPCPSPAGRSAPGRRTTALVDRRPGGERRRRRRRPWARPWPSSASTAKIADDRDRRRRARAAGAARAAGLIAGPSRSKSSSNSCSRPGGASAAPVPAPGAATPQRSSSSRHSARPANAPARARSAHSPQAGRRLERPERRGAHGRQHALAVARRRPRGGRRACSSGRSRNGVGPGPTATSASEAASGEKPGGGDPLGQPAERQRQPRGVGGGRAAQHAPALDGQPQARRQDEEPAVAVAAEVEHAAHLAAADAAPAGDGARRGPPRPTPPPAKTIRTCAPRPEWVSSASTGPNGLAASAAGLVR